MSPYNNTNPCPRCGGTDYIIHVGDGPEKPGDAHYIHTSSGSYCKTCGYSQEFWNHKTGFIPPEPYKHSIHIENQRFSQNHECRIPLEYHRYLVFPPEDTYIAIQAWHKFQEERHKIGLTEALDNVVKNLDLKPAKA